ncbi:unnamed protein product [Clonostachys rhizophaga]|uniref:Aminotransferase class I/classII large domain-containing protein n=1 Tax=Clonostachys rhizophaga TaxID=160324 RepID=A0A9N9VFA8_9HYPO|nr:unnamed protein product [Clonostachys rhizophaga]
MASLSTRCNEAAHLSDSLTHWKIVQDLWDPDTNPSGFVNLGIAENSLMHDTLSHHIHQNISLPKTAFTYGDGTVGSERLREAVARFLTKHFKPARPLTRSHISITNGCNSSIEQLSWACANPGEAFLLGQPHWGTFVPDLSLRFGTRLLPVPFHDVDPLGDGCVQKYEDVILGAYSRGEKVAGLVICNPHNPLGRCYSRETLVCLLQLCEKYQIHFISDEIYALSVWSNTIDDNIPPPNLFVSVLSIDPQGLIDPARIHIVWGLSKDFGASGLRVGSIVSQSNETLHKAMTPSGLYTYVSAASDHIAANILEDMTFTDEYIAENRKRLGKQYEHVVRWTKAQGISHAPGVNAAFFIWLDLGSYYRRYHPETDIQDLPGKVTQELLGKKVFLASGKDFGAEKPGWFRIVFAHEDYYLHEGLGRIAAALGGA